MGYEKGAFFRSFIHVPDKAAHPDQESKLLLELSHIGRKHQLECRHAETNTHQHGAILAGSL